MSRPAVFALVAAACLAGVAEATAAPAVELRPPSSPPGRLVTVIGQGFCAEPGCSRVSIQIAGVPVATGVAVSPSGSFTRRVRVPGVTSPGPTGVVVVQRLADGTESTVIEPLNIELRLRRPPKPKPTPSTATATTETQAPEASKVTTSPGGTRPSPPAGTTTAAGDATGTEPQADDAAMVSAGDEDDGGGHSWTWVAALAGAAAIAAGAAAIWARRRRRLSG